VVNNEPTAPETWAGLLFALVLALLTVYYRELARTYPEAGTGSSYYFAGAALLAKPRPARLLGSATSTPGVSPR
jgi:hypothetical protein